MPAPITLVARFTAVAGREGEISRLLAQLERRVRVDPGTLTFWAFQDQGGQSFTVWEQYLDDAAFQDHIAAPHVVGFNELLVPLIEEDGSVLTFMTPLSDVRAPRPS